MLRFPQQVASVEQLYHNIQHVGMTGQRSALLIDSAANDETLFFRDQWAFVALENDNK
jgi:hypothetical protein